MCKRRGPTLSLSQRHRTQRNVQNDVNVYSFLGPVHMQVQELVLTTGPSPTCGARVRRAFPGVRASIPSHPQAQAAHYHSETLLLELAATNVRLTGVALCGCPYFAGGKRVHVPRRSLYAAHKSGFSRAISRSKEELKARKSRHHQMPLGGNHVLQHKRSLVFAYLT